MKIIEYNPKYKDSYIKFNKDWIVENFGFIENADTEAFNTLEKCLQNGSMVFMAIEYDTLLAGCMAKKRQ